MKKTSSNIRMCVITKKKQPKDELIKISKTPSGWKMIDQNYVGRSIYLQKDKKIILKFLTLKKYRYRHFEMNEQLKEELSVYAKNL